MTPVHLARRQFYDAAEPVPELARYLHQYRIDQTAVHAHAGVLAICLGKVFGGNSGDRVFQFDPDGIPIAVLEALASDGLRVVDLVAWPLHRPEEFATAVREADMLGAWHMLRPAGKPLHVYRTPLSWAKAGCEGCVPVNREWAPYWLDRAGGPFVFEDIEHAEEIKELMGLRARGHRFLVPEHH